MTRFILLLSFLFSFLLCGLGAIDLSCTVADRNARFFLLQDTALTVFRDNMNSKLLAFESWASSAFGSGYTQALASFRSESNCWNLERDFDNSSIVPAYSAITTGPNNRKRDVLTALYIAATKDWNTPLSNGRKTIFVYASDKPILPPVGGRPPFDESLPADTCSMEIPALSLVVSKLNAESISLVFVVNTHLINYYTTLFSGLDDYIVLSFSWKIIDEIFKPALEFLYCRTGTTTSSIPATTTASIPATTTASIPATTTSPASCPEKTVLQLLHLQDVSSSYTNDLVHLKAKMPTLLLNLKNKFFERRVALGTFVDKPSGNTGYPGDYCYREDSVFSTDETLFTNALNAAKIKSGRDWAESQFDAIYDGVKSTTLGWMPGDMTGNGKHILRVVMVATDAGPHFAGDHSELPATHPDGCHFADYPTKAAITQVLSDYKVYPIIVVTNDMYPYWKNLMNSITSNFKVIPLAAPIDQIIVAIEEALDDICNAAF